MRKIGCFGNNDNSINFEWPKANDLMQMPKNISIKLAALKYYDNSGFMAFQVVLSNGISSPVFISDDVSNKSLKNFAVSDYSLVKRVKGTPQDGGHFNNLSKLSFGKKDGTEITKVETDNYTEYGPDYVLNDSEEIIGIYGSKETSKPSWYI